MDCSNCESWNNGRGKPACLKCKQYKDIQIKSVKRQSIKTEHVPDAILENIADPRTRDLMGIIRQLPSQYSVPIMMRYFLNMTLQEVADQQGISKQGLSKKINVGLEIIKESLRNG